MRFLSPSWIPAFFAAGAPARCSAVHLILFYGLETGRILSFISISQLFPFAQPQTIFFREKRDKIIHLIFPAWALRMGKQ